LSKRLLVVCALTLGSPHAFPDAPPCTRTAIPPGTNRTTSAILRRNILYPTSLTTTPTFHLIIRPPASLTTFAQLPQLSIASARLIWYRRKARAGRSCAFACQAPLVEAGGSFELRHSSNPSPISHFLISTLSAHFIPSIYTL
jgi:hypothetical protein